MTIQQIFERLTNTFGSERIVTVHEAAKDPWIEVAPSAIHEVGLFLRDDAQLQLDHLCDLTGVDYLEPDAKLAKNFPYTPHLEVVYHLYSYCLLYTSPSPRD